MSPLPVIPSAEILLGNWVRTHPDVEALDARVGTTIPSGQSRPWVIVTQLDATDDATSSIEHLIEYLLQFDCYAGGEATVDHAGQSEALLLARTVRAVLKAAQGRTLEGVVVSAVGFAGMARVPDIDFEPARERYVLTATIAMHS